MNLPTLRANPMGNKTCTQVIAGSSAHGATVRAISVLLPNEMANEIITRCNAYPALTARVKELEEALAEAVGWNWLDGDVPQEIQDKCCDPLNKEPKA